MHIPESLSEKVRFVERNGKFDPDVKWRLVEEFGPDCYTEAEDGRLLFAADYTDMENLIAWILTFGEKVEVLEPVEVRERLVKIAEAMSEKYRRD